MRRGWESGEGLGLEGTLVSSGGRLPSDTKIGEGGYHGETYGAELTDLAYKGLGGTVPPHSRAESTAPSACYAMRVFYGCCKKFHFISFTNARASLRLASAKFRHWPLEMTFHS
jgi:hypothetical protein